MRWRMKKERSWISLVIVAEERGRGLESDAVADRGGGGNGPVALRIPISLHNNTQKKKTKTKNKNKNKKPMMMMMNQRLEEEDDESTAARVAGGEITQTAASRSLYPLLQQTFFVFFTHLRPISAFSKLLKYFLLTKI